MTPAGPVPSDPPSDIDFGATGAQGPPSRAAGAVSECDPASAEARKILDEHLEFCRSESPPEDVHALDVDGLLGPAVTFFGYRVEGELLAVGALKVLGPDHGEVKSMHTARAARRCGAASAVLAHIVSVARRRGLRRLSLETGSTGSFLPARAMYLQAGFVPCGPFAGYTESPNSTFMTLQLEEPGPG